MLSTVLLTLTLYLVKAQPQKTTIWTDTFTTGVAPTAGQCQNWVDFWQFWIGDPSQVVSITLGGSLTSTTYTCSGSAAQFVAFAIGTPPYETTQVTCESGIWFTGMHTGNPIGNSVGVISSMYSCTNNPAMRPCWPNKDWGGIGSANCAAPTQTFTVSVVSNSPTVTVPPGSVSWTDSFTYIVPQTSTQCYNWQQFWQNTVPKGNSLSVTLTSDINGGVSATCSGPGVNLLATALFTPTSNGQYHCNEGTVWYFNGLYNGYPNTSAIVIGGETTTCSNNVALRPCWNQPFHPDFGSFYGANCNGSSQTFTATVTIGTNTISNACWQQVNVAISTGTFTISCNPIMLLCNANYLASGYGLSASGLYTCTNAVWSSTVPSCNVVTTTSTTTSTTTATTSSSTTTAIATTVATLTTTSTSTTATPTSTTTTPTTTSASTTTGVQPITTAIPPAEPVITTIISTSATVEATTTTSMEGVPTAHNLHVTAASTNTWWWMFALVTTLITTAVVVSIFATVMLYQTRSERAQQ